MTAKASSKREIDQLGKFKKTARELKCDEDEEEFDTKLKRIASQKREAEKADDD